MRRSGTVALVGAAIVSASIAASAQVVQRCKGETFAALAAERLGDARLGPLVAMFNGQAGKEACVEGRFVRFPATIRHEVRLGQTIDNIAARFTRGAGGAALIRSKNGLPPGAEPDPGALLELPAELVLKVGSRPARELADIHGLPPLPEIRAYNGTRRLTKGGTVYVPLFFDLLPKGGVAAAPAPPPAPPAPPPRSAEPPPPTTAPETLPDATPAVAAPPTPLGRVLQVAAVARSDGFRHPVHAAVMQGSWQCNSCHAPDPRRPHGYLPVGGALCTQCHSGYEATAPILRTYRLGLAYSHGQHLAEGREVRAQGYEPACNDCHPAVVEQGRRAQPAHAECVKCHNAQEVKPTVAADCSGCHAAGESMDRRQMAKALLAEHYRRSDRDTDIVFGHSEHVALYDAASEAACDRCHAEARSAETLDEIEPQRMSDCLDCHQGLKREMAGASVRLDRCKTCHLSTRAEFAPVFSQLLDKPLSHTRTFRRRHGEQAAADDGVCATCHSELVGGPGANCNACHQQIRPQNHTVRWRETPHGRAAVRDPDNCSTCHLQDRCADCHAEPPRDHFPQAVFQLRHGRQARVSTRRCLTCHVPQVDCARCHDLGL